MSVTSNGGGGNESDIKRLLDDLLQSAATPHAKAVLRDAVWAIEDRAFSRTDQTVRDPLVEQRVRDTLGELSKPGSPAQSLEVAVELIDALIGIDYTDRVNKFTRLCRSLLVILQCGNESVVKQAQKVFSRIVEQDALMGVRESSVTSPLKEFLPKEMKDMSETVAREADGRTMPSKHRSLALMIAAEALMIGNPRYFTTALRTQILGLSVALCGSSDASVRSAAYDCLAATLGSTSGLRAADVQGESRKLAEDCNKNLRASHNTESLISSTLLCLRALIKSRGVASIDKQLFTSFCTSVLEQHKITRSQLVKNCVCSLVPYVAKSDPMFASRKAAYCAIMMDPLKNLRDETNKAVELANMADFLRHVGYDALDPATKVNLESVVQRYISRPSTQLECWNLLAAIVRRPQSQQQQNPGQHQSNQAATAPSAATATAGSSSSSSAPPAASLPLFTPSPSFVDMIKTKCLPHLARAPVTLALLEHLDTVAHAIPSLTKDVVSAQQYMIDVVLRRAAQNEHTAGATSGASPASLAHGNGSGSGVGGNSSPAQQSGFGFSRLVSYFNRNSGTGGAGGSSSAGGGGGGSEDDQPIVVTPEEIEVALVSLSKRPVLDSSDLVEELRVNVLTLQRHPSSRVRRQCSQTILACLEKASGATMQKGGHITAINAVFLHIEELLEAYLKNAVMELEPQCRMAMVEAFCGSRSVMQLINRHKVLNTFTCFLNDTSRIREVAVRALVEACQQLKKEGVDVSDVERQLKITVETCIVALEFSTDHRLLLRHLGDLTIFTRYGVDPVLPLLARAFVALNRKLKDDSEMEITVTTMLRTLRALVSTFASNDSVAAKFFEEVSDLQRTTLNIFLSSTSPLVTVEAIKTLVVVNNVFPLTPSTQGEVAKLIECLSTAFINSKQLAREDVLAILTFYGQLGAVKPQKVVEERDEEKLASDADLTVNFNYATIVYRCLSRMLESSLPDTLCCQTMRVVIQLVHASPREEIRGVHAMRAVVKLCKRTDSSTLRVESLHHLSALITHRHQNTVAFLLPEIVVLLDQMWSFQERDTGLFYAVLAVVEALQPGSLPVEDQRDMWPWLYPRLIDAACRDTSPNRDIALKIVNIFAAAKNIPLHCVPFLTATLTGFIQQSDQPSELRGAAIVAVVEVVCSMDLMQHVTPLLHALRTLARHLELSLDLSSKFSVIVKDSLKKLLKKFPSTRQIVLGIYDLLDVGGSHASHALPRNNSSSMGTSLDEDRHSAGGPLAPPVVIIDPTVVATAAGAAPAHAAASSRDLRNNSPPAANSSVTGEVVPTIVCASEANPADVSALHRHVERSLRITESSKWRDWLQELQRLTVLSSPHFALRLIAELFEKHEPLRREVFFPAFKCLYESLSTDHVVRFNQALEQAVLSNHGEVSATCLSLADYLDHHRPFWEQQPASSAGAVVPPPRPLSLVRPKSTAGRPEPGAAVAPHSLADAFSLSRSLTRNLRELDGLDNPDFFHSMASVARPVARKGDGGATAQLQVGSMNFPQTPAIAQKTKKGNNNNNHNNPRVGNPHAANRLGAVSDLAALEEDSAVMQAQAEAASAQASSAVSRLSAASSQQAVAIVPGECPLIGSRVLIDVALRNGMFDKGIRFLEAKLAGYLYPSMNCGYPWKALSRETIEEVVLPLAQFYSKMGMQASVVGLFESVHYLESHAANGIGFELLRSWDEARMAYSASVLLQQQSLIPVTHQEREGFVRTLCLCGEWKAALQTAKEMFRDAPTASSSIPVSGATAAWILGEWDDVSRFAERIVPEPLQYFFVNGVVFQRDVAHGADLLVCIRDARLSLESSLRTLLPVSYAHAYDAVAMQQHFQEILEASQYRRSRSSERRRQIREVWVSRFSSMKSDNWIFKLRSLMIHSLVLKPTQMADTWLQFCESVRGTYPQLANWAMHTLQSDGLVGTVTAAPLPLSVVEQNAPNVRVGFFEHLWDSREYQAAISGMQALVKTPGLRETDPKSFGFGHLQLGLWLQEQRADAFWKPPHRDEILSHLHEGIRTCPDDYDTWHAWALMNYRIKQRDSSLTAGAQIDFVARAHQGFVAAVCLSPSIPRGLQDVMRLLQLWIVYDGAVALKESIADAVQRISVEHWVQVVPQLIAHLGNESHDVRDVVSRILEKISRAHPQIVVFPLLVNVVADPYAPPPPPEQAVGHRERLSRAILESCIPSRLRKEAENVARSLCTAASLPVEQILEHLTQVSDAWTLRLTGSNRSAQGTMSANSALEDDSHLLRRLEAALYIYRQHPALSKFGAIGDFVQQAINYYKRGNFSKASEIVDDLVFEIGDLVKKARKVSDEAERAMEPLASTRNLSVCVFGEYNVHMNPTSVPPTIASFTAKCDVIRSKKRPRKIRLTGSNGSVFTFLLKSNEDIRLDERVMQLFGLVNSLMHPNRHSQNCVIYKFPVIPISANVGLLGWVEYSDTMHDVITNYRRLSGVDGQLENTLLASQFDDSYEDVVKKTLPALPSVYRAEAVETVFRSPTCESADLARSLWRRSASAELWLERRTAFTESLATMSMVGYILGLGDRHLGNIMLSMSSGRVIHIDFGDSFDVCRVRQVLPETVPFRLTRMFIHAMEVFGVDGLFRSTCVSILTMLSQNRDSIIALLSAFIYDPIVSHQHSMRSLMEKQKSPQDIVERIRYKLRGLELAVPEHEFRPLDTFADFSNRPDLRYISNAFNAQTKRDAASALAPKDQVQMLIGEACSVENLASMYYGWAPLW